jgi:hypothetical protein
MEWAMGAEKHVNMACTCQRRRRSKVQRATTQLSVGSEDDFSKYKTDEDDANIGDPILNDVRHDYEDASWSQEFFTYDPTPREYIGSRDPRTFFAQVPTIFNCSIYFGHEHYYGRLW